MTREEAGKKLSDWVKYMEDPSAVPELDQPCTDDEIIEAMSIAGKALSGTSTVNDGLDGAAEYFDDVIAMRMFDEEGKDISEIVRAAVKFGAEWQKNKMLEGAVEGYVNYYEDSGGILMAEAQVGCPYHNGDKVKIIIVKED